MTDQTKLANKPVTALAVLPEDQDAADFFRMTLPYGNNLTNPNAVALAQYCRVFGLSAQNGEAYYMVKVKDGVRTELGVYPGIRAWRKKAKEHLENIDPQATYKIDYEMVDPSEVGLKRENVAMCIKATLRDDISRARHMKDFIELLKCGMTREDIDKVIGKPPVWIGYGTVKTYELPYLKMEPRRVAEKRAEKDATSRRFDLPFGEQPMADEVEIEAIDADYNEAQPPAKLKPRMTEAEIMGDLGYQDEAPAAPWQPEVFETGENTPAPKPEAPAAPVDDAALLAAMNEVNSQGELYGSLPTEKLALMSNALRKTLSGSALSADERTEKERKHAAIKLILASRQPK